MKPPIDLPSEFGALVLRDQLEGYASDPLHTAMPAAVVRPRDAQEISALLSYCHVHGIPVTPCGSQTSLTAAALSDGGVLLSSERLDKAWRIHEDKGKPGRWLATVGVAANLADFQDAIADQGFFYPPDPTSRADVMVGATVATNASGEDSYKYGSTRRWVRGMTYVMADGEIRRVFRPSDDIGDPSKNACGYPYRDNEVDLLIGSEGTLGVMTEVVVEVLPFVPEFFSLLAFFESEPDALVAVQALVGACAPDMRCCEYMDSAALEILARKANGFSMPSGAQVALYIKQEFNGDSDAAMTRWFDVLDQIYAGAGTPAMLEHVQVFDDPPGQRQLRAWRHLIPATINERAAGFHHGGGGKVGTDWYVPVEALVRVFREVRLDQRDADWVVFGHIGNGHPHFNFIAPDAPAYANARDLLTKHCRIAVANGGGVSGEHGIGKKKAHLLEVQYDAREVQSMLEVKRRFDPSGILAPGNIFPAHLAS